MKLALVNLDRTSDIPPLGLAYLASYLRKYLNFYNIVIVDKEDPIKKIKKEKPDIVGISSTTTEFPQANNLAREIKARFDIPLIIGGYHISLLPKHLSPSNFDIGVIREGEQTMLELMKTYERYGSFPKNELRKICGIVFRNENKKNEITKRRKLIEPLDLIPFPARDLLKREHYLTPRRLSYYGDVGIYTTMHASRGCPYNCCFCASSHFWKRPRFNSPEYIVEEIKELIEKFKVDGIEFVDDLFVTSKRRLEEIVSLFKKEGINERLKLITISMRADSINKEICKLLKEMNATMIGFGLESGSEKILKYLKNDTVTVKDNRHALRLCKQFGFKTWGTFIIGSPEETLKDLKLTLDLVRDKNLDIADFYRLTPFPGTKVWNYTKKVGKVTDDINFDFSQLNFITDLSPTKKIGEKELRNQYFIFQKEVAKKRYLNRKTVINLKYFRYLFSPGFIKRIIRNWKPTLKHFINSEIKLR